VATDADETNTPIGDQATREPLGGTQQLGDLGDG
jgi:hypothetical protein